MNIFADDTLLIFKSNDLSKLEQKVNDKLKLLFNFLTENRIQLNESKTEWLLITKKIGINFQPRIMYDNNLIRRVNCLKILGFLIDDKLTFKSHMEQLISKVKRYLPVLHKLKRFLSIKELMKLYHALINSLLTYCILIYRNGNETSFHRLFRIQKMILKIILNGSSHEVLKLMVVSKVLSLPHTYNLKLLKLGHKMIFSKHSVPLFLQNTYTAKTNLNLRNKDNFITPYFRTSTGQRSIRYSVAQLWNKIPSSLKLNSNEKQFLKKAKEYLLNSQLIT